LLYGKLENVVRWSRKSGHARYDVSITERKLNMDTITLGSFIKERREQLGKTLRGFAAELDIAAPYLHDIEKDNRTPSEKLLPAFIKGLRLSREDETTLYDLVGRRRQGLYPDLSAYIQNSELARVALRKARDCNIPDTMWIRIIDSIDNGG